jgi:23S rRNA pseudouridine2605 synthase
MERLNKFLAHAGVGSRRHCDDLIHKGRVSINGLPVREMGMRVDPADHHVSVDGRPVESEPLVYWLVHKPPGYLCTNHDPAGRPRALDLISHVDQRVYTVGRLDEDSEGLLLMTNDGDLAFQLMHPRFGVSKTYLVHVAGKPSREDLDKLLVGVFLSDGHVKAKRVKRMKSQGDSTWLEIVLNEGKNREIRRMLAQLEHKVIRLKRMSIGPLHIDRLPKGKSRRLTIDEVTLLREAMDRRAKRGREAAADAPEEMLPRRPAKPRAATVSTTARSTRSILDPRPPRRVERPEPRAQHPGIRPEVRPEFAPRPAAQHGSRPPRPAGRPVNRRPLTDRPGRNRPAP